MGKLAFGSRFGSADNYLFFHLIYGSGNATADILRSLKSGDSRSKSAVQFQNMMCSTSPNVTIEVICYENFVGIIPV